MVIRTDHREAAHVETGLPAREAAELVESAIEAIAESQAAGDTVMISGFGSLRGCHKGPRMGRNRRTGEPAEISPHRAVVFRRLRLLKSRIDAGMSDEDGT